MGTRTLDSKRSQDEAGKYSAGSESRWCNCPADCGIVLQAGHEQRVKARAELMLSALRGSSAGLTCDELRKLVGMRGGEALVALLSRGLIEHIGERGTASAGYRVVI